MASTSWRAKPDVRRDMPIWQAVADEARELTRVLAEPWLWLAAAAMLLCGTLAYLVPYDLRLDIGGSPKDCNGAAVFDVPYIVGFNPEPEFAGPADDCTDRTIAYRWAFEDATVEFPGIGRVAYDVVLRLTSGQPTGQAVPSTWIANGAALVVPVRPEARAYHLLAPPSAFSSLRLDFQTSPYQPPGDPRALGFAVDRIHVSSLGPAAPSWFQLLTLTAMVTLAYLMARHWALSQPLAASVAVVAIAAFVALLIWQREGLTIFSGQALRLMLVGFLLAVALEPLARGAARALEISLLPLEARRIVALVVIAWLIRALGLLHPQTYSSDVGLHMNNLLGVTRGEVIFTEGLPAEAGGGAAPYPPALYVMLAPWQLLNLDLRTLVTTANALADSLAILWIWLVLRLVGASPSASYFAAGLYLFATPLLRSLSTGEMANVWGQSLVLPWLLALLLWRKGRVTAAVLGAATAIALLGHSGVFLSLGLLLAALGVIWLVHRDQQVWKFALVVMLVVVGVVVGYFFAFLDVLTRTSTPVTSSTTPLERLGNEAREFVVVSGQIGPLLAVLGLSGLVAAWYRWRRLGDVLAAWWLSTLLSWSTLLFSQQALRWEAFLFPALVLGGGLALAELWRQGAAHRWTAAVLLFAATAHGGILWVQRLITYR